MQRAWIRRLLTVIVTITAAAGMWGVLASGSRPIAQGAETAAATKLTAGQDVMVLAAKDAAGKGKWSALPNPLVVGGVYMSATGEGVGTSLEFPIEVDRPTEIAVSPIWFTHGDQRKARRFPDPVPYFNVQQDWSMSKNVWEYCDKGGALTHAAPMLSRPGPDVIDTFESKAFFSAPAGGKVGILDLRTDTISGSIDIGGYVSDLLVDKARGELLVADAGANRIVIFGAKDGKQLAEVPVPALPWSIALYEGKLFVAAMAAKKVVVLDVASRKLLEKAELDFPAGPQHVEISAGPNPQLVVRLLPMLWDVTTHNEVPADRLTYWPSSWYAHPLEGETEAIKKASEAFPKAGAKVFFPTNKPPAMILDAGMMNHRIRASYEPNKLPPRVYLAEPGVKGVTVFWSHDDATASTSRPAARTTRIELDDIPAAMSIFDLKLYVMCKETKKIHIIDVVKDKVVQTMSLPYQADEFYVGCLVPKVTTVEQITCGPLIGGVMPGRIAVGFHPLAFDTRTLAAGADPGVLFFPYDRRTRVQLQGDALRRLRVDNLHTIQVNDKQWIDVSAVTDFQLAANPARLMPGDVPGAVTLQMDDSPECDWENDVWFTPDYRTILVRGTDEFQLNNAVRFAIKPGKHVLKIKAHSPNANIQGIQIRRTLAGALDVRLLPLPEAVHKAVPAPSYGGIFAASEDVAFKLNVANKTVRPMDLSGHWTVLNYEGKQVLEGKKSLALAAGAADESELPLAVKETGRFTIHLTFTSPDGMHEVYHRFVKLPKIDHPRMLYRAEQTEEIRTRIAKYPLVFQRYRDWLRRNADKPDFLPKSLKAGWTGGAELPLENLKWRAIAMQFSDMFLENPGPPRYESKLLPLLSSAGAAITWQGNYEFGESHSVLNDLMMPASQEARKNLEKGYSSSWCLNENSISGNCLADYLLTIKEPLSARDRSVLYRSAMELTNYDRYFQAHAGSRGGNWWHDTTAWCRCPIHSMVRAYLWFGSFFGEDRTFERTHMRGILTLQSYAYPHFDTRAFLYRSAIRETNDTVNYTAAMRWALSARSRLPLEKTYYKEAFDVLGKLGGSLKDEAKEVDELLARGSNVVLPMYLALGWIDPALKEVQWEEMPPSMLFDVEGAACMKSGWDKNMTDIYFVSGVKDTSYRVLPNHFHVFKAGEMVIGMAQTGDHGDPVAFYGNTVRVGEDERFPGYLHRGWGYARQEERWVTNVFSTPAYTYMFRDWRLSGYRQDGTDWEGGGHSYAYPREISLHTHTAHPFLAEGGVLAYETSPIFDYVLGDASNFWPLEDVREAYRQFVFVRPDVIVVYDRLLLCDNPKGVKWPMRTLQNKDAPQGHPQMKDDTFFCSNGRVSLWGRAMLPKGGKISSGMIDSSMGYVEIEPAMKARQVEFLVAMRIGLTKPEPLDCRLVEENGQAGVAFEYENRKYSVRFNRAGDVGGRITVSEGGKSVVDRALAREVRDTYENWKGTSMFDKWMSEDRFKAYVTEADRKRFGSAAE